MIRRSSLTVSGSSCSSSEGKSSGWRPIQAPTYRFGGSVTLASRRSRKGELETCFEHSLNVLSHKAKTQSNKLSLYTTHTIMVPNVYWLFFHTLGVGNSARGSHVRLSEPASMPTKMLKA